MSRSKSDLEANDIMVIIFLPFLLQNILVRKGPHIDIAVRGVDFTSLLVDIPVTGYACYVVSAAYSTASATDTKDTDCNPIIDEMRCVFFSKMRIGETEQFSRLFARIASCCLTAGKQCFLIFDAKRNISVHLQQTRPRICICIV